MATISVKEIAAESRETVAALLAERWGTPLLVSRGRVHNGRELPGFLALSNDNSIIGLATFNVRNCECEIVSLDSLVERQGVGTRLFEAVMDKARKLNCRRLWLVTTNDNLHAIRFYQKREMRLVAVHRDAIVVSRKLKPSIPMVGHDSIPIRDEIEFELML